MNKTQALQQLAQHGMNTHEWCTADTKEELAQILEEYDAMCSVRFDCNNLVNDLPFYLIDGSFSRDLIDQIWADKEKWNASLIVSNGHQYDNHLLFNMSVEFQTDGTYRLDICSAKVPLRKMYAESSLVSVSGYLFGKLPKELHPFEQMFRMEEVLFNMFVKFEKGGIAEVSMYDVPVGQQHNPLVYWQVSSCKQAVQSFHRKTLATGGLQHAIHKEEPNEIIEDAQELDELDER